MLNIYFTSTNTSIRQNTLKELVFHLSEHFARLGQDSQPILITDSDTGEIYEVIENEKLFFNHKFTTKIKHNEYNILQLLELIPYFNKV